LDDLRASRRRRFSLSWAAAPLAVPFVVVVWWFIRPETVADLPGPGVPAPQGSAPTLQARVKRRELAHDGVPIKPAGSVPSREEDGPMHPHPITPQHERIFRENNLVGDLNGAMDVKDVAGMRRLLRQYREEYPEDSHLLQDGYAIIAECLERPGPALRARAQRYYDDVLASTLRRYVRRHCLEAPVP
jgi:hypothetical protein